MKRGLAVLALILLIFVFAMGQGKKKPPMPPAPAPLEAPMKSPHRLLVNILPGGKIKLNDRDITGLEQLGEILQKTLEQRELGQHAVVFDAPSELKYGELAPVLGVVANSGGAPIFPYVEDMNDVIYIGLAEAPDRFGASSVSVPSVVRWEGTADYGKNSVIVTIPKTGIYMIRGVKISSDDEGYELALASQIGMAMKKLGPVDLHVLYVNCEQDALYSDIRQLIKAARTHTMWIDFWVKSAGWQWRPMEIYRAPRRRNNKK